MLQRVNTTVLSQVMHGATDNGFEIADAYFGSGSGSSGLSHAQAASRLKKTLTSSGMSLGCMSC